MNRPRIGGVYFIVLLRFWFNGFQLIQTVGKRGPQLLQDVWFFEKMAHFDREAIPERRMHAKGSGAYGTFTVAKDILFDNTARNFSGVPKEIQLRQLKHCYKANPAYGMGIGKLLGIDESEFKN